MATPLRILYLEDQPYDVELAEALLTAEGFACSILRVETRDEFEAALEQEEWDLIFSDKTLPEFDGLSALALACAHRPDVPFIFVSGTLGEEVAIESLRNGATDYVLKQRLKRLVPVTRRALREAAERRERQQAQDALAASARHFRALIEHSSDGILLLGADGVITFASEATGRILGYAPEAIVGRVLWDLIDPADQAVLAGQLPPLGAPAESMTRAEYRIRRADGAWRWIESTLNNLLDEPAVHALVFNYRDITESKQAQDTLRENEQRLFQFLEAVPLGLIVFDPGGRPYYANQAAQALLGWGTPPNAPDGPAMITYPLTLAGTEEIYPVERRPAPRALAGETSTTDDMEVHHPDRVIPLQVWGAPIYDAAGNIAYAIAALADISERKQVEAELHLRAQQQATVATLGQRALTASTLDGLLDEAVQLAVAGLAADYCALSELTPDGQTLVVRSVCGWPTEWVGQVGVAIDRTTQAGATLLANAPLILDEQHPQPDFVIVPAVRERGVRSAISVVIPGLDRPFGTLVVHSTRRRTFTDHDIHFLQSVAAVLAAAVDRVQSIAAQAARAAAEQANAAKSEFLSRMSHELRTPLHAILGFGQLLELADLSLRQQESVAHIQTAGQHLLTLINEVLDISRIEAGRMALSPEPVLLRDVLEESLTLIQPGAAQRQIEIVTPDLATATPYVMADHQRLKQVLLNLLSNAVKYNRFGGRVEIAWETKAEEHLHLTVRDTGRGIPGEFLPQLFTPFARGEEQAEVEGTGLGLALSQRLLAAMAGRLALESTGPSGSTFGLDIPLAAPPAPLAVTPVEKPPSPAAAPAGPQRTLLLIDDNPSNLRLVERMLELRAAVTILAAQQGQQGLELARTHRPDLIFLDLQLPDIGGDLVLRRLLDDPVTATIPVVIFSADATPGQISRLRAAGATDYLTKPFRVATFLDLIDRLLLQKEHPPD